MAGKLENASMSGEPRGLLSTGPGIDSSGESLAVTPVTDGAAEGELAALIAALDHARGMANFATEVRMRNFNFFVLLTAAMLAGHAQLPAPWSPILGFSGIIISALFFALDVRGRGLLERSIDQLTLLEPLVWKKAGVSGWSAIPRHGGARFISHKWLYRIFFVTIGAGSFWMLVRRFIFS